MRNANYDRELGLLLTLTGNEQVKQFGEVLLTDAQKREILAQRGEEFQHRKSQPTHLGEGFMYDPTTKQATQDPNYAAYSEQEHRRRLEFADAQNANRQGRVTGTELKNLADMDSKLQLGRDALTSLDENPEAIEPYADTATNAVKSIWPDMGNLIEGAHKSEGELDTLNKMRRYIAGIRKSELGSALTGYELTKAGEWDPTAGGIDYKESKRRMNNLVNYLEQEFQTLRAGRSLSTMERDRPMVTDAEPASAQPQATEVWDIGPDGKPVRVQ